VSDQIRHWASRFSDGHTRRFDEQTFPHRSASRRSDDQTDHFADHLTFPHIPSESRVSDDKAVLFPRANDKTSSWHDSDEAWYARTHVSRPQRQITRHQLWDSRPQTHAELWDRTRVSRPQFHAGLWDRTRASKHQTRPFGFGDQPQTSSDQPFVTTLVFEDDGDSTEQSADLNDDDDDQSSSALDSEESTAHIEVVLPGL